MLFIVWYFPEEIRLWVFLVNDFSTQTYTIYEDTLSLRHNVEPCLNLDVDMRRVTSLCWELHGSVGPSPCLFYMSKLICYWGSHVSHRCSYTSAKLGCFDWGHALTNTIKTEANKTTTTKKLNLRLEDEWGTLALCCLVQIWKQVVPASRIVWGDSLSPANPVTSPLVTDTFWPLWVPAIHIMHRCTYRQTLIYI